MVAKVVFAVVSIALCLGIAVGFSNGPPARGSTCNSLRPGSSAPHVLQDGNGTYDLTVNGIGDPVDGYFTYTPGSTYTGIIQSDGPIIRGFLVQAWDPAGNRIGSFGISTMQQHLACSSVDPNIADVATLVHNAPHSAGSISFSWLAPNTGNMVDFRFTIVRSRLQYFGPLSAASSSLTATTMSPSLTATTMSPSLTATTMSPGVETMSSTGTAMATQDNMGTTARASGVSASFVLFSFIAIISTLLL